MLFTEFLREGGTRTLKSVRTWHADIISMAPRTWHPLVRCRSGVQDYEFFWETTSGNVPVLNACWFDSGNLRQSSVLFFLSAHCLDRQWIQICVSLQSSFVFQRNAWFTFVVGRPVESPQMQIVDTIMGMPVVVAVQTVLTVWRWTSLCCRSDKFQLLVDFLGPCAQAQGRGVTSTGT